MTPTKPDHHAHDRFHAAHGHADHDGLYNEDVAHEYSDVNVRGLLMFCVGLIVVTAVVQLAMWGLFVVFERQAAQNDPVVTPLAVPAGRTPPEPRLLTNEPANLEQIKAQEAQVLQGYGWVDQAAGSARIPIDEAMKKLVHEGLPVRPEGPVDDTMGTSLPSRGESSGGRIITAQPREAAAPPAEQPKPPAAPHKGGH